MTFINPNLLPIGLVVEHFYKPVELFLLVVNGFNESELSS